uniref:Putative ribonuclease H-like domain-containing protein n=1 Tax=Tanacetum cinerariifolium TaxID=118510 RepID=A0A6L2M790_TANCI|nr:putative ribonuclease H-like domain-containing protein [Tanacetum cinerariifolium]
MLLWKDNSLFDSSSQASDDHNKDKHGPSQASKSDNQERPNAESSTKTVNTATPTYADYPNDPLMPDLEDAKIFDDAYDDIDEGVEADYNNLEINLKPLEPNGSIETKKIKKELLSEIKPGWLFLAYASFMDFTVYQMDVKSAFLYGTIKEEVYVRQPPGFVDPEFPNRVYKVEKALYGLHQAPRAWYETLSTYLLDNGFRRGTIDKTLFIKKIKDDILLVQVYVDDIIFGSTKRSLSTEFEQLMYKRFQMSSMGELTFFLGLQVDQQKNDIFLSLDKYVSDILKKFVKRIFRYLKGQPTLGLWYPKDSPLELIAYSDSDYAGVSLDRKSTTGGCQFLGSRLIWQCKKQTIMSNSTTKAEYIAASNCCGQVLWLQNQLLDYGYKFMQTKIHVDNESSMCMVKNPVYHSKTNSIEIRHHFIRDSYEKRLIEMVKIHTDYNVADLLTKAFDVPRMECKSGQVLKMGLKLKGFVINDGYADLVQHAGQTETGKELSNPLMAGSLPKTTLPTLLCMIIGEKVDAVRHTLNAAVLDNV